MASLETAKKIAAYKAVDDNLQDNLVVGVGSGSTIIYAVHRIAELIDEKKLNLRFVPTSYQARLLIRQYNLPLTDLEEDPILDLCIDGADEVDQSLVLIKGGGGCLTQEKIVAFAAKKLIIVADYRKNSLKLGETWSRGIPIEVLPMAHVLVKNAIESKFGGIAILRKAVAKMGPVISDNGNFLLDWKFPLDKKYDWLEVATEIKKFPGVIETGLFVNMAKKAYFGHEDGSVSELPK